MATGRFNRAGGVKPPKQVCLTRLGGVVPKAVRWLWPKRVPLGKVTLLVGDPGRGKSLLALDMAARVTRGAAWPDAASGSAPLGRVILLSAEDDVADTIRPRLEAAGGDPDRVVILHAIRKPGTGREGDLLFSLLRDVEALEAAIRGCGEVRLVVLDPVSAYLGGVDSHSNADMRAVLAPLRGVAERTGVAVVAISHLTKRAEAAVLYRAMGSLAFVASARAVWAVGPDREAAGRLLFLPVKCNLAAGVTGMAYRIVPSAQSEAVPVLAWEAEPLEMTAQEAFALGDMVTRLEQAAAWLEGLLSAGPRPVREVERLAHDAGFRSETLKRAKRALGILARHRGFGSPWVWGLPGTEAPAATDDASASAPSTAAASGSGEA